MKKALLVGLVGLFVACVTGPEKEQAGQTVMVGVRGPGSFACGERFDAIKIRSVTTGHIMTILTDDRDTNFVRVAVGDVLLRKTIGPRTHHYYECDTTRFVVPAVDSVWRIKR